jgi:hypothetical protein
MTDVPPAARRAILAALAAVVMVGLHPASAAPAPPKLRDGLFKKKQAPGREFNAPPVARYVTEDGGLFTLDRSQGRPLIRFDDSPEVWVLTPQPAPRGDVIYKDEMGQPVLRATRLGGITLFNSLRPNGQAVSYAGVGIPLRMAPISPQALSERLLHASIRSGRAARHTIPFEAEATPASSALMGDAALIISVAFLRIADRIDGRSVLAQVGKVQLIEGAKPACAVKDGVLIVTVAPSQGLAGRPSSDRLVKLLLIKGR